jgi:hypothetical protein
MAGSIRPSPQSRPDNILAGESCPLPKPGILVLASIAFLTGTGRVDAAAICLEGGSATSRNLIRQIKFLGSQAHYCGPEVR